MNRDEAINVLRDNHRALQAVGVAHAYLFGSIARNEADAESDIDVMIDVLQEPFSMLDLIGVQQTLEDLFRRRVDVVVRADALQGERLKDAAGQALHVF